MKAQTELSPAQLRGFRGRPPRRLQSMLPASWTREFAPPTWAAVCRCRWGRTY